MITRASRIARHWVNQKLAQSLLTKAGYVVETVDSGVAAVSALRQRRYEVVLMDVQMPGMDDYVTKPLQPEELFVALERMIARGDRPRWRGRASLG